LQKQRFFKITHFAQLTKAIVWIETNVNCICFSVDLILLFHFKIHYGQGERNKK